jgi:DNA polymerase-3 subunit epsilon
MLLFIDTETTGKVDFKQPWDHPSQPHLVQLGALLLRGNGTQERELNCIIRPTGYTIPPEATAIHGITTERALAFGVPLDHAMAKLQGMIIDADDTGTGNGKIIAHNLQFDTHIVLAALALCSIPLAPFGLLRPFCTMRALTDRMKLPGNFSKYKWPTLDEAWHFMHPDAPPPPPESRHTAMGDVLMCRDIYFAGLERGWWP